MSFMYVEHFRLPFKYLIVIQARFKGEEYALAQGIETRVTQYENECMLKEEYENLVQGEEFRKSFEEHAQECDTPTACMSATFFILFLKFNSL